MKCHQLQFCITKKPRTKLPNSGRIVSQGRKALILHETLWKVHQSQILTGAQEFPSLWQEEMHFAYLMAVGSSRLQQLEKLWLSDSEGTGTIRAHPFWKGSQRVQPPVVELKINWKELTVAAVGMEVAFQRILEYAEFLEGSWRCAVNCSVLLGDLCTAKTVWGCEKPADGLSSTHLAAWATQS